VVSERLDGVGRAFERDRLVGDVGHRGGRHGRPCYHGAAPMAPETTPAALSPGLFGPFGGPTPRSRWTRATAQVYMLFMRRASMRGILLGGLLGALVGCSSSSSPAGAANQGDAAAADSTALPAHLAVTADWEHHTLSLVDFDALVADKSDAARIGTIDLSQYIQGPYTVKITPDGKTALVSLSTGFFSIPLAAQALLGATKIPSGPSKV